MNFDRAVLVAGTRPEFVKLHPVAVALTAAAVETLLVTTEQHWSPTMKDAFFSELEWPCRVASLGISARDPLGLVAEIARTLPGTLTGTDLVMVEGDTTSVLGAAIVANKLGLPLAHVEAGLRSYDLRMPEEHNRRVCDHLSDLLFAPTEGDAQHLRDEQCLGSIIVTGNTVLDAVRQNMPRARPAKNIGDDFVLVTLHRQENVDSRAFLAEICEFFRSVQARCVFPVHPRTVDKLRSHGLWDVIAGLPNVDAREPMGYLTFLDAMRRSRAIVTDSGGIQEEATAPQIRRPAIVLRRSTERPAAVEAGFSILAPVVASTLVAAVDDLSWFRPTAASPFGDGHAAEQITSALRVAAGSASR
jgi:UDP-N-acetylglucosamine 2-epimerase (non-hydrolysing)